MTLLQYDLEDYTREIQAAYLKAKTGLTINLVLKIEPTKDPHVVNIETSVSFVESRIKTVRKTEVDDR
jgi:hypothetical protein